MSNELKLPACDPPFGAEERHLDTARRVGQAYGIAHPVQTSQVRPDVGTIYCIDLFESALNSNRKVKVVHETDTPHAFDVT
jgi:hypothetical protein